MRKLVFILLFTIPFSVIGQKDSLDIWISKINNGSIGWTCNYNWVLNSRINEVDKIIMLGKKAEKKLIQNLTNEDKGVVIHYILSNINKQTNYQTLSTDSLNFETKYIYNGLEFTDKGHELVTDQANLLKCKEYWIRKKRKLK